MKTNKEMVYEVIQDTLNVSKKDVTSIKRTPGGETNVSYFVTIASDQYVIRLPGRGTDKFIDRKAEQENLAYGTNIGINPETIYFDAASGVKITRQIYNATELIPRQLHLMKDVIHLLKRLHESPEPMSNHFDLFAMINYYESLIYERNSLQAKKLTPLKLTISELKTIYQTFSITPTPCHIDAVCSNILKDQNDRLYLIDWEYSGMFDPLWDIATLSLSLKLTDEEEKLFLTYYFERQPMIEEIQRLHVLKIFLDYHWGLWYFYKEAQGEDHGSKGLERMQRLSNHLESYKVLSDDNPFVS